MNPRINKTKTKIIDNSDWNNPVDFELRINGEVIDIIPLSRNLPDKMIVRLCSSILTHNLEEKIIKRTVIVQNKGINFILE